MVSNFSALVISYLAPGAGSFKWLDARLPTTQHEPTSPANLDPHWPELVGAVRVGCPQIHAMPTCSGKKSCQTRLGCKHGPTIHAQKWKPFHTCGQQPLPKGSTWLVRNKLNKSGAFRNAQHYIWKCQQTGWFPTVGTVLKFPLFPDAMLADLCSNTCTTTYEGSGIRKKKHVKVAKQQTYV